MDVRYLEYILEIAEQRSITKAKDRLFVSQSTLSQYLIRLEQEIGTPLFYRRKNELVPTPAGQLYLEAARNVVEIRRNLYAQIAALQDAGRIRMAVSSSWGMDMMAHLAPDFHEHYPHVTLDLVQERFQRIRQRLLDGRLDLAVTASSGPLPLEHELLRREEIVLAVADNHPAADVGTVCAADFRALFGATPFVRSQPGSTMLDLTQPWLAQTGADLQIACEVNDNRAALTMIAQGMGMAFVPRSYAEQCPGVRAVALSPRIERPNLLVLRANLQRGPAENYLIGLIRAYPLFHAAQPGA